MKSIQKQFDEWLGTQGITTEKDKPSYLSLRRAFFAGFDSYYCLANNGQGIDPVPTHGVPMEVLESEKEMDAHSEEEK